MHVGNSSWAAAKIILAATTPIQKLIDHGSETHLFINNQALIILCNDGYAKYASFFKVNINNLNKGTVWADRGWKCFAHYYNPATGEGLNPWPNALDECQNYFSLALRYWSEKKFSKSIFLLGATAHLVQDLCVPHHARCVAFNGHQKFERWSAENVQRYETNNGGIYNINSVADILKYNAIFSSKLYNLVSKEDEQNYNLAAKLLLPLAQKSTAGLFKLFMGMLENNNIYHYKANPV